jgi:hypothetical protein
MDSPDREDALKICGCYEKIMTLGYQTEEEEWPETT